MSHLNGIDDAYFYETQIDSRRRWLQRLALLLGLAIGIASGLYYTWQLEPVEFYDTDPVDLKAKHQQTWILLVSAAYRLDGNLERANARLSRLQDPQIAQRVADLAQSYINQGKSSTQIRALALLADALGARTDELVTFIATPEPTASATAVPATPSATPTPTASATAVPATPVETGWQPVSTLTPNPTRTQRPTRTPRPTATPVPPYMLERKQKLCRNNKARIEVFVQTDKGVGMPGVEIWVTWSSGADRLVTGLKPDVGLGYADFDMQTDVAYQIAVGDPALKLVSDLSVELCRANQNDTPLSSWRLIFVSTQVSEPEEAED